MEEKGSLGIFLLKDKAIAVWTSTGPESTVLHKMCVTPSADEPTAFPLQAARAFIRQGFSFEEVFVAVDCGRYTQYNLHSEFEEYRQIESTIKFDAEEAATIDAMNLAVAFEVAGLLHPGAQVTAYTADRQLLTDILLDLQEGGLDPTVIEPDAVCLARALEQTCGFSQHTNALFVILSGSYCYLLGPGPEYAPSVRTFLVSQDRDVTSILTREILLASASRKHGAALESVILVGHDSRINTQTLAQGTGLSVQAEKPEKALSQTLTSDSQMTIAELLIAYGAATAAKTRGSKVDFRRDFMPYQGKRKVMEGSLRLLSISLTVLLLAVAGFFQLRTLNMKGYANQLKEKTLEQYKAVMFGNSPPANVTASMKLKTVYNQVKAETEGLSSSGDNTSVPARLTFLLEAINNCKTSVDINVQQIKINERSMKVKGDTNNRSSTNALLNEVKKHPHLKLGSYQYDKESSRDSFEIAVEVKE